MLGYSNYSYVAIYYVLGYKVLRLKASNEAEAAQWIHNIEDAIATLRTQYSYL